MFFGISKAYFIGALYMNAVFVNDHIRCNSTARAPMLPDYGHIMFQVEMQLKLHRTYLYNRSSAYKVGAYTLKSEILQDFEASVTIYMVFHTIAMLFFL